MIKYNKLQIEQLDSHLDKFINAPNTPENGWISVVRKALGMSLRQLASRLSITPQSMREIEQREKHGTISLKILRETASALNMKLVYGFVPSDASLQKMLDKQAHAVAEKIVKRTDATMQLENQAIDRRAIAKATAELAEEIKSEMPRYLWD